MIRSRKLSGVLAAVLLALLALAPGVASAAPASATDCAPNAVAPGCWYQVRWGDTLSSIAARYGVSTAYLQQYNGIANANYIFAGRWLHVPCGYATYSNTGGRHYYYSGYYGCWGYSYYNSYYGRNIYICTG